MGKPEGNQENGSGTSRHIPAEVVQGMLHGEHEPKSERCEIRFSKSQIAALDYIAHQLGINTSEVIRRSVFSPERLSQMATRREWALAGDYVGYRRAVGDLKTEVYRTRQSLARVGNNVNQVARKLNNSGKTSVDELSGFSTQFQSLRVKLEDIDGKLDRLLECYEQLAPFEGE